MKSQRGFIALISVIIIGAILLVAVVGAGFMGYYGRFNVLDFELKERSDSAADACVDQAILQMTNNAAYTGNQTFKLNSLDSCFIGPISLGVQRSFHIQATSSNAVTDLAITVDGTSLSILSWKEIPNF